MLDFDSEPAPSSPSEVLSAEAYSTLYELLRSTVPHVLPDIASDWLIESAKVLHEDIEAGMIDDRGDAERALVESLKWHIRRKRSFGASEMSALYTEFKGDWYPFGTAADVVKQKLCLSAVEHNTGDTSRGTYLEPKAREMYIKQMRRQGIYLEPDDWAKNQLSKLRFSGGIPGMEWMDCSPDDIFLDQDGRRYLVDYKTPADEDTISSMITRVPEYYMAQLGQEQIMLEYLGIPVDEIQLIPLSVKNMSVSPIPCVIDEQMKEDIVSAGNYYWGFVEKLELPRRPPSKDYEFVAGMPQEIQLAILEFAFHNKAKNNHINEETRLKGVLKELLLKNNIDLENRDKKVSFPMVDTRWQTTRRINQNAVLGKLKEYGEDTESDEFWNETEAQVMSLTRSKSNRYHDIVQAIDDFSVGKIATDRSTIIAEFQEKFAQRDSVTIAPKKAPAKSKAKVSVVADTPSPEF